MSISKPAGMWFSMALSNHLISNPPRGPAIMAPMNMVMSAPTMTPRVAMAPATAPRWPPTILPPV